MSSAEQRAFLVAAVKERMRDQIDEGVNLSAWRQVFAGSDAMMATAYGLRAVALKESCYFTDDAPLNVERETEWAIRRLEEAMAQEKARHPIGGFEVKLAAITCTAEDGGQRAFSYYVVRRVYPLAIRAQVFGNHQKGPPGHRRISL